jgi:hypothetical protein
MTVSEQIRFMRRMRNKLINAGLDMPDLVRASGLAHTTISRAYNGDTTLRPQTRSDIELTVDKLTRKDKS